MTSKSGSIDDTIAKRINRDISLEFTTLEIVNATIPCPKIDAINYIILP